MIETKLTPSSSGVQSVEICMGHCIGKRTVSHEGLDRALQGLVREPKSAKYLTAAAIMHDLGEVMRERDALARAALALADEIREHNEARR